MTCSVPVSRPPVWPNVRKTPQDAERVKPIYDLIASKHEEQRKAFKEQVLDKMTDDDKKKIQDALGEYKLEFDFDHCHVRYCPDFEPIALNYDLCYVRHGKTEGNTEPRIFQGCCDYWENQLTAVGQEQARSAAEKMEKELGVFKPDLILCSPLGRAVETGEPFFSKHPEIPTRIHPEAREQQFGCWDNVQVRFFPPTHICHLFYLDQNALVKASEPHVSGNGEVYEPENFVDLILRMGKFLKSVCDEPEIKHAEKEGRRGKVLVYGHSMAGAAISVLLGHGKKIDDKGGLGFDGKYIMPNATPTLLVAKNPNA